MSIYGFIVNGNTEQYDFNALENKPIGRGTGANSFLVINTTSANIASGEAAFAAGEQTTASGSGAIAIGRQSIASGTYSFAGGNRVDSVNYPTTASGTGAFAFGASAKASGQLSIALGQRTEASSSFSIAAGNQSTANQPYAIALGNQIQATGRSSVVIGQFNVADDNEIDSSHGSGARKYLFIVGNGTADNSRSNAMTVDWDGNLVVAGSIASENGEFCVVRGTGSNSAAVVNTTRANTASGEGAFAAGRETTASGGGAMSVGGKTLASGDCSFAGGSKSGSVDYGTTASGNYSFAYGLSAKAEGASSVAIGQRPTASALGSAAIGNNVSATGRASMVVGQFNVADDNAEDSSYGAGARKYLFIVGNGTADNARSNAMTVDWDGNLEVKGEITTKNGKISDAYPVKTLSDKIVTFSDGADLVSPKELKLLIDPIQNGSDIPSPTNIRAISSWTGGIFCSIGQNLNDNISWLTGYYYNDSGEVTSSGNMIYEEDYIPVKSGAEYCIRVTKTATSTNRIRVHEYDSSKTWLRQKVNTTNEFVSWTVSDDAAYIRVAVPKVSTDIILGEENLSVTYDWQSAVGTVYGGTIDVLTGILTIDRGFISATWGNLTKTAVGTTEKASISLTANADGSTEARKLSISNIAKFVNNTSDTVHYQIGQNGTNVVFYLPLNTSSDTEVQLCYYLATPITYQLTAYDYKTLLGENLIAFDAGNTSISYRMDPSSLVNPSYVATMEAEIQNAQADASKALDITSELSETWKTHLDSKIATINTIQNSLPVSGRSLHFIFFTDYHLETNDRDLEPVLKYLYDNTDAKYIIHGGDAMNHPADETRKSGIERLIQFKDDFKHVWNDMDVIIGNHDWSTYNVASTYSEPPDHMLTLSQLTNKWFTKSGMPVANQSDYGDYFIDDAVSKVRYILMGITYKSNYEASQVDWLAATLLSTPNDYDVLPILHRFLGYNSGSGNRYISDASDPFLPHGTSADSRTAAILNLLTKYTNHQTIVRSGTTYDYTNKTGSVIMVLSGHVHCDLYAWFDYTDQTNWYTSHSGTTIPAIAVTCDSRSIEYISGQNRVPISQSDYEAATKISRSSLPVGDIRRHAFDDIIVDIDNRLIYLTRIGAGDDAVVAF